MDYQAALSQVKADLHASDSEIATSLSAFIIVQGITPLFWSSVSELKGRKVRKQSTAIMLLIAYEFIGV